MSTKVGKGQTVLHEELHNRLKLDGVYGQEFQSKFRHHPPRGVYVKYEAFNEFVNIWIKNPTEETYKTILQQAREAKEWWR